MTSNELKHFLEQWEREYVTTVKVLQAIPDDRLDYKPAEKSRSLRDLMWHIVGVENFAATLALTGAYPKERLPPPATVKELLEFYERQHKALVSQVAGAEAALLSRTVDFFSRPVPVSHILWRVLLYHQIHHRGQLSVYLRLVGAKVPSIYGPSADES